jgi:hypothetical protein
VSGFKDGGSVSLVLAGQKSSAGTQFGYLYDVRVDNYNNVTLQGFSTNAAVSMKGPSGVYYDEYKQFLDYYGDTDYGDKWVMAAANRNKTGFKTGYVLSSMHNIWRPRKSCCTCFLTSSSLRFLQTWKFGFLPLSVKGTPGPR